MPAPMMLHASSLRCSSLAQWARWQLYVRSDGQRSKLGTWPLEAVAHRACSTSASRKALGSVEKRAKREVAEGYSKLSRSYLVCRLFWAQSHRQTQTIEQQRLWQEGTR